MQEKHFKLRTDLTIQVVNKTLYRIEATKDSRHAIKGALGGYVEKEENLQDNAWVSGNAYVSDNAQVSGDARISGNAQVSGNARIYDNAQVSGDARISGNAQVSGNARIYDNARISGDARISGNARISGDALVYGDARISDNALVSGDARISGDALVYGNTRVSNNARISGDARVYDDARVSHKMILKKSTDLIYISGLRFNASISLTGINVGCKHYVDLQDFESRYKKEGQENHYTDIELKYLHTSIKNTLKLINKL